MKKLLVAMLLGINSAQAMPVLHTSTPAVRADSSYDVGYRHGKNDALHAVATTVVVGGILIAAGIIIYQYNEQSRWGVSERGVTYAF